MTAAKRWAALENLGCPTSTHVRANAQAAGLFTGSLNDLWAFIDTELQVLCESSAAQVGSHAEGSEQELQAVQVCFCCSPKEAQHWSPATRPSDQKTCAAQERLIVALRNQLKLERERSAKGEADVQVLSICKGACSC